MFEERNGKIFVSQQNINRVYHGTHSVWEVLRNEGIIPMMKGHDGTPILLMGGEQPYAEIIGVEVPSRDGTRTKYYSDWTHKFVESIPTTGEKLRIKEIRVKGLPPIAAKIVD